jgi:hypothetical protein
MMNSILSIIKKAFLWSYPRNTWQWDVLCVLILIFIFMTPKSWFANSKPHQSLGHPTGAFTTVLVGAELVDNDRDKVRIEQRVRALTGKANAQVIETRSVQDSSGKTVAYEVDIR